MRILVLHRNAYAKLRYADAIDHAEHNVIYFGTPEYLQNLPEDLRCERIVMDPAVSLRDQLLPIARDRDVSRVIGRHESHILPAAEVREALGLPGMRTDVAIGFRDKLIMKNRIASAGLRTPRTIKAGISPLQVPWVGKTVVKPVDGAASVGVAVYATPIDALEAVAQRQAEGLGSNHDIEEFLDGEIWHVDGFVYEGAPIVVQCHKYVGTCLEYAAGAPMGSVQWPRPDFEQFALDCITALGAPDTTFHLELIATHNGPAFLETAARAAGGYKIRLFELKHGINLHCLDIATQVELRLAERFADVRSERIVYGDFLFPGHSGCRPPTEASIEKIRRMPGVELIEASSEPLSGGPGYRPENLPLAGIVAAKTPEAVHQIIERVFEIAGATDGKAGSGLQTARS